MNSAICLIISALAWLGPAVAKADAPMSCYYYDDANTTQATCNEYPGRVCSGGCRDSFVVAEGCKPSNAPTAPLTTQTCNISFGRYTAAAKACVTTRGTFSCTGGTSGSTNCYGCHQTNH